MTSDEPNESLPEPLDVLVDGEDSDPSGTSAAEAISILSGRRKARRPLTTTVIVFAKV